MSEIDIETKILEKQLDITKRINEVLEGNLTHLKRYDLTVRKVIERRGDIHFMMDGSTILINPNLGEKLTNDYIVEKIRLFEGAIHQLAESADLISQDNRQICEIISELWEIKNELGLGETTNEKE